METESEIKDDIKIRKRTLKINDIIKAIGFHKFLDCNINNCLEILRSYLKSTDLFEIFN